MTAREATRLFLALVLGALIGAGGHYAYSLNAWNKWRALLADRDAHIAELNKDLDAACAALDEENSRGGTRHGQ